MLAGRDRADRTIQDVRDLGVGEVFVLAEEENDALGFRQRLDRLPDGVRQSLFLS